jgi:5-methylcytosine-specific restriction protein A
MNTRFTHKSKTERGRIRKNIRISIFERDENQCQFCMNTFNPSELTVDHLVPLSKGGLDEVTNYVTCCFSCNQEKADKPLHEFAQSLGIEVENLPVHGDPVIDNQNLPIQIRIIRKRVFDKIRLGEKKMSGQLAQKKIEKTYRREFWESPEGKKLEAEFPSLPGQVRIMIPEIRTIASNEYAFLLLLELAKSAVTRNLIGSVLTKDKDILKVVISMKDNSSDEKLRKRLQQSWSRFKKELLRRNLSIPST